MVCPALVINLSESGELVYPFTQIHKLYEAGLFLTDKPQETAEAYVLQGSVKLPVGVELTQHIYATYVTTEGPQKATFPGLHTSRET